MTLIPVHKLNALAEPTALVWEPEEHPVIPVVLAIKQRKNREPVEALKPYGYLFTELVVRHAEWNDGHPVLTYGVEEFRLGAEVREERHPAETIRLFRYCEESRMRGPWWSPTPRVARQEGGGRHDNPILYVADVPRGSILLETVCRFGKQYSPPEFIVDTTGVDIQPFS